MRRSKLAHPFSGGVHETGVLLESLIHLYETVVGRVPCVVEQNLDDAETFVDGLE
jgi:hypothetical protein